MSRNLTDDDVKKLARLSSLVIDEKQAKHLVSQFDETLKIVSELEQLDTKNISATCQVTGLVNVFREDVIDPSRQFTQQQALQNASKTHKGYIVVPAVINQ